MKNLNKLAFGVLVCAMALGMSAFTNANKFASGSVYGSQPTAGSNYTLRSNPYDSGNCSPTDEKVCGYIVTAAGESTVTASQYTEAQLEAFANASPPKVTRTQEGIYSGL